MSRAEDLGDYYKIPAANWDLNYDKYFVEGNATLTCSNLDYNSSNTEQLNQQKVIDIIKKVISF
jgi:UDP-glucose 4-epimerase